jgi:hypothetical protein
MAIDHVINYLCEPKDQLTTQGILMRLKGRDQAARIIQLFRDAGDDRPPQEMGFEFTRSAANGDEETAIIKVSEVLAASAQLEPLAHHCEGCPANVQGKPFGCFGRIGYPISEQAERWLLLQLPLPEQAPLVWTLLQQNLRDLNQHTAQVQKIRESGNYFEAERTPRRKLGEIALSGDNVFYFLFMQGHTIPSRAAVTLLFFDAIPRNIDATDMMKLAPAPPNAAERYPLQVAPQAPGDDSTITEIKAFLRALYTAWRLHVDLLLDT